MFGYIKVYDDELKIKDYKIYKSYYCGLCKTLGKRYNLASRFTLNYDFTFMALLLDSFENEQNNVKKENCIKTLPKKDGRGYVQYSRAIDYTADIAMLFTYYKIKDDLCDTRGIKRLKFLPLMAVFYGAYKKAKKLHPEIAKDIENNLKILSQLEKDKCDDVDMCATCFSDIIKSVFNNYTDSFDDFSVALGRYIYCIDAYDDLKDDIKNKQYNPYIYMYRLNSTDDEKLPLAIEAIQNSIYMTLAMLGDFLSKINFKKNTDIINNIVYLGMRKTLDSIAIKKIERNGN